jgi:2,4-dienoyl-CoA reductase-like NADH-dependent reductase (Old Yellow Enzyme family)
LFQPFTLRGVTLPNRIVMPAMGLETCHDGLPGKAVADHCARRITGGTGLILTEGVYIDHHSSGDNPVLGRWHGEDAFASWRGVAEAVHAVGGLVMPELWHAGHGYLIDQFLWAPLNQRTDRYGGTPRARGQFAAEVVAECRRRVGPDFPILFRISDWKLIDYTARLAQSPQELEQLLAPLVDAGVDLFDCSQRRFWEPTYPGNHLNLAGWTRKVTGVPTMTVGSVGLDSDLTESFVAGREANCNLASLTDLMARFNRGEFDLVGVGRALIVEPEWANHLCGGALDKLKPYNHSVLAHLREDLRAAEAAR